LSHRLPKLFSKAQIVQALERIAPEDVIAAMRRAFAAYSGGAANVSPVVHLGFADPPGDVHVKCGGLAGDDVYVVKIAAGFYRNSEVGLPPGSGMMIVLSARTGFPQAILDDQAYLTDYRTAAAGAMTAQLLAPSSVEAIGIVGTGLQAHLQLDLLRHVTPCRTAYVWGRDPVKARAFRVDGFDVTPVASVGDLAQRCNLIITTTAATHPLLFAHDVMSGRHVTAMGSDMTSKQELDPNLFAKADVRAVDSRTQCFDHGDAGFAVREGIVPEEGFVELGEIVNNPQLGRTDKNQITVADLTGVAVQDVAIAKLVYEALS
jgi:ornithine cyclodeaminase